MVPTKRWCVVVTILLFLGVAVSAQNPRELYYQAVDDYESGDYGSSLAKLEEVRGRLGSTNLRIQPLIVRNHIALDSPSEIMMEELRLYFALQPEESEFTSSMRALYDDVRSVVEADEERRRRLLASTETVRFVNATPNLRILIGTHKNGQYDVPLSIGPGQMLSFDLSYGDTFEWGAVALNEQETDAYYWGIPDGVGAGDPFYFVLSENKVPLPMPDREWLDPSPRVIRLTMENVSPDWDAQMRQIDELLASPGERQRAADARQAAARRTSVQSAAPFAAIGLTIAALLGLFIVFVF